jgi:hypothetical protein
MSSSHTNTHHRNIGALPIDSDYSVNLPGYPLLLSAPRGLNSRISAAETMLIADNFL